MKIQIMSIFFFLFFYSCKEIDNPNQKKQIKTSKLSDSIFSVRSSIGGIGTGFLVKFKNEIFGVTALHVVASDNRIILEKEINTDDGFYKMPFYAEVIFANSFKDLALLRFPKGFLVEELIGTPLPLMTKKELLLADGSVEAWGITNHVGSTGRMTRLHSKSLKLISRFGRINTLNPFTGQNVRENNPLGFVVAPSVHRGFSGGPVLKKMGKEFKVLGVSIIKTSDTSEMRTSTRVVSATEIISLLKQGAMSLRTEQIIFQDNSIDNIRPKCEQSITKIFNVLKTIPSGDIGKLSLLKKQGELYRYLSPYSRRYLFNFSGALIEIEKYQMSSYLKKIADGSVSLDKTFQQVGKGCKTNLYGSAAYPTCKAERRCSQIAVCVGTNLFTTLSSSVIRNIQNLERALKALRENKDKLIHKIYLSRLIHSFPKVVYQVKSSYRPSLSDGRVVTDEREGEQISFFRFKLSDSSGKNADEIPELDFEFAQGFCGLSFDRLKFIK